MKQLKKSMTKPNKHQRCNCFLFAVLCHAMDHQGWLLDMNKTRAYSLEELTSEVCGVPTLEGKPKLVLVEEYGSGKLWFLLDSGSLDVNLESLINILLTNTKRLTIDVPFYFKVDISVKMFPQLLKITICTLCAQLTGRSEDTSHLLIGSLERTFCFVFTARIRSMGQGNVFTLVCHSVHTGREVCLNTAPLVFRQTPRYLDRPPQKVDSSRR